MKNSFIFIFLFMKGIFIAQTDCSFIKDTIFIPKENKTIEVEYLETNLKNKSTVKVIKAPANKYYMKMVITENLYFDRTDLLEIRSGSKSFYVKEARQFQNDEHSAFYVVEIYKNYIGTLKDYGVTSLVFNKAETVLTKQDSNQIKQIAKCFYETIAAKK